jgi:hypothetical protein
MAMKTQEYTVVRKRFQSEVQRDVATNDVSMARVIAWGDENPVAWKIVTTRRSQAFGIGSCVYIGWAQRSVAPEAILERLRHFKELIDNRERTIFTWRARFTLKHYQDKGFTGGFFQQHDEKHPRSCLTLDHTPETLKSVINQFTKWMDSYYATHHITVDGKTVRTFRIKK